jgi:hypothetical protein
MRQPEQSRFGFTMMEVLIWCLVSAGIMSAVVYAFHYTVENAINPTRTIASVRMEQAPSHRVLTEAISLHRRLRNDLDSADMVFVFGGENANPIAARWANESSEGQATNFDLITPTKPGYVPTSLANIINATDDKRVVTNAFDARIKMLEVMNPDSPFIAASPPPNPSNFSVFCLKNDGTVLSVTQCSRSIQDVGEAINEQTRKVHIYVVKYFIPSVSTTVEQESYSFFQPPRFSASTEAMPVGARHYWYRYEGIYFDSNKNETDWRRHEAGPVRLVFPDPFAIATSKNGRPVAPFSRFTYMVMPTH